MVNEAVLIIETGSAIPFTVANGTAIEKGALLKITTPRTASAGTANAAVAGIAVSEKIADDGKVGLGVFREGLFRCFLSGSASAGDALILDAAPNHLSGSAVNSEHIFGTALEDGTSGQSILVELKPITINVA